MSKIINLLLVVVALSAAGLLLYPTASDQYNQYLNARTIYRYNRTAEELPEEDHREMLQAARAYNETLQGVEVRDAFTDAQEREDAVYEGLLDVNGDGIMGVIEIPKIGVRLPIYHGTGSYGLERGVGHMEGTSLPVGGEGAHCGLSGHRGLPSARLFTDLDQMERGDLFFINVLGELLVYQVDQVNVVLPHELEYMAAVEGEDLVTLVTCTPYGVNTHRLLVRGRRTALEDVTDLLGVGVTTLPAWRSALICALPVLILGLLLMLLIRPKKRFGIGRRAGRG